MIPPSPPALTPEVTRGKKSDIDRIAKTGKNKNDEATALRAIELLTGYLKEADLGICDHAAQAAHEIASYSKFAAVKEAYLRALPQANPVHGVYLIFDALRRKLDDPAFDHQHSVVVDEIINGLQGGLLRSDFQVPQLLIEVFEGLNSAALKKNLAQALFSTANDSSHPCSNAVRAYLQNPHWALREPLIQRLTLRFYLERLEPLAELPHKLTSEFPALTMRWLEQHEKSPEVNVINTYGSLCLAFSEQENSSASAKLGAEDAAAFSGHIAALVQAWGFYADRFWDLVERFVRYEDTGIRLTLLSILLDTSAPMADLALSRIFNAKDELGDRLDEDGFRLSPLSLAKAFTISQHQPFLHGDPLAALERLAPHNALAAETLRIVSAAPDGMKYIQLLHDEGNYSSVLKPFAELYRALSGPPDIYRKGRRTSAEQALRRQLQALFRLASRKPEDTDLIEGICGGARALIGTVIDTHSCHKMPGGEYYAVLKKGRLALEAFNPPEINAALNSLSHGTMNYRQVFQTLTRERH